MKVPARPDMTLPELPAPAEKLLEPPHPHHNKFFIILLIIFFGVGVFMLFFTLHDAKEKKVYPVTQMPTITQTPTDPVTEWETYTDTAGKFIIKYPKNYQLLAESQATPNSISIIAPISAGEKKDFTLVITYDDATKGKTLSQLISQSKLCNDTQSQKGLSTTQASQRVQPCAAYITSVSYLLNKGIFYTVSVQSLHEYNDIKKYVNDLVNSLSFDDTVNISNTPASLPSTIISSTQKNGFCTQDAKSCPDGSSVSRTGPNCTFAACPGK